MADTDLKLGQIATSIFSATPPKPGTADAAFADVIGNNATTQAPPQSPFEALNRWEDASDRALSRYRNWLTANMIKWLADWIRAPAEARALAGIKGTFAQHVAEHAVAGLGVVPIEIGVQVGEHVIARLFLEKGAARVLGGIAGFVITTLVETAILGMLDKTGQVIGYTADQISELVTGVVNPIVDSRQRDVRTALQKLRADLVKEQIPESEWRTLRAETVDAIRVLDESQKDAGDLRLYRMMALMSGVYQGASVTAEETSPVTLPPDPHDVTFTMQHTQVKTGQTEINVATAGGLIVVRFHGYDCIERDGAFVGVDATGPEAPTAWKTPPPPREYYVTLYQKGTISDTDVSVARAYHVGKDEYGVWFNLPPGSYYLRIERSDDHIVALAADGQYWAKSDL